MRRRRHGRSLRRRYGRAWSAFQSITQPAAHGHGVDVVRVDGKGTKIATLARNVSMARARAIITGGK
jgi:hypothetical protein